MDDLTRIKNALTEIGCKKHLQKFVDEEIDWGTFLKLNESFLLDRMKIPLGKHRSWFFLSLASPFSQSASWPLFCWFPKK
jgi:hypothetical protein